MKKLISVVLGISLFLGIGVPVGWMNQVQAAEAEIWGTTAPYGVYVRTGPSTTTQSLFALQGNITYKFDGWEDGQSITNYSTGQTDSRWLYYVVNDRKYYVPAAYVDAEFPADTSNDSSQSDLISKVVKLPSGYYDEAEANKMITNIEKFGTRILQGMVDKGVEVYLVNGPITDHPAMSSAKGVTPRGWEGTGTTWDDIPGVGGNPTIIRIGHSDYGMGHGSHNLELHETAHAVDLIVLNNYSNTYQFKYAFNNEADNLFAGDGYNSVYPEEYFAEATTMYLLNDSTRTRLQQNAPYTYQLLENTFSK